MMLTMIDIEVISIEPNDEYQAIHWNQPDEIICRPDVYHPCLLQMARGVKELMIVTQ